MTDEKIMQYFRAAYPLITLYPPEKILGVFNSLYKINGDSLADAWQKICESKGLDNHVNCLCTEPHTWAFEADLENRIKDPYSVFYDYLLTATLLAGRTI
jgi:hypothetical protein